MYGLFQQSNKFAEGSGYQSVWPLPLEIIINGVKETVSTLYKSVNENLCSESELSFFERARQNRSFQHYHAYCDELAKKRAGILKTLRATSLSQQLMRYEILLRGELLGYQEDYQNYIISPVAYDRHLRELFLAPHTNKILRITCREVHRRLKDKLKADPKSAQKYFYNDLINHLIQLAGNQISLKVFQEDLQQVFSYYREIIEESLYYDVTATMQPFLERLDNKEKILYDEKISDQTYLKLTQQLSSIFDAHDNFSEEDSSLENVSTLSQQSLWQQLKQTGSQLVQTAQEHPQEVFWGMVGGAALGVGLWYASETNWKIDFGIPASWKIKFAELNGVLSSSALSLGLSYLQTNALDLGLPSSLPLVASMALWMPSVAQSSDLFFKTLGGPGINSGASLAQTTTGDIIVTGITNPGSNNNDVYLGRLNSTGQVIWEEKIGGPNDDVGQSVVIAIGGGFFVSGYTASGASGPYDLFLLKCDENGNILWTKRLGGSGNDQGLASQATADGGCIVVGFTSSPGVTGGFDVCVSKWDADGNLIWIKIIGGGAEDRGYDVKVTPEGYYLIGGSTASYGSGGFDKFLLKLDALGNLILARVLGGSGTEYASGVQVSSDGKYYVAVGPTNTYGVGGFDQFLSLWYANGTLSLVRTLGGSGNEEGFSVQITNNDTTIAVCGHTNSVGAGNYDMLFSRWLASGSLIETKTLGTTGDDDGYNLQKSNDGGYLVNGVAEGRVDSAKILIVKADNHGNIDGCPRVQSVSLSVNSVTPSVSSITPQVVTPVMGVNSWALNVWNVNAQLIQSNQSFVCEVRGSTSTTEVATTSVPLTSDSSSTTGTLTSPSSTQISTTTTTTTTTTTDSISLSTALVMSTGLLSSSSSSSSSTTSPTSSTTTSILTSSTASSENSKPSSSDMSSSNQDDMLTYVAVAVALGTLTVMLCVAVATYFLIRKYRQAHAPRQQSSTLELNRIESSPPSLTQGASFFGNLPSEKTGSHYPLTRESSEFATPRSRQNKMRTIISSKDGERQYSFVDKLTRLEAGELEKQTGVKVVFETNKNKSKFILPRGKFGKVILGRRVFAKFISGYFIPEGSAEFVAIKKIKGEEKIKASKNEAYIQSKVKDYPHVMPLLDVIEDQDDNGERVLYLIMPFYGFGNGFELGEQLAQKDKLFKIKMLVSVAEALLKALAIHEAGVFHLDIKPTNFVLDQFCNLGLIDWGCAVESEDVNLQRGSGDGCYFPPERIAYLRSLPHIRNQVSENIPITAKETRISFKGDRADVWELGITLLELWSNAYPFKNMTAEKLIALWDAIDFANALEEIFQKNDSLPADFVDLLKGLLRTDPEKRLTPEEALGYPIFKNKEYLFQSDEKRAQAMQTLMKLSSTTEKEVVYHEKQSQEKDNMNSDFYMSSKEAEVYNTTVMESSVKQISPARFPQALFPQPQGNSSGGTVSGQTLEEDKSTVPTNQ